MKTRVALDFKSTLSDAALAQFALNVIARMQGNPKFSELQSVLDTDLQPAADYFQQLLQASADGSRSKIAEKSAQRPVLLGALQKAAGLIDLAPHNTDSLVLEAGFNVRQHSIRGAAAPETVQQLRAANGECPGEALLYFKGIRRAVAFGVEWSTDGEHWHNGVYTTAHRAVVRDLPSRQEAWFRVFTIGSQQRLSAPCAAIRFFVL